jgi:hypothetical protein
MPTTLIGFVDTDNDFDALCLACAPEDAADLDHLLELVALSVVSVETLCSQCGKPCTPGD